MTIKLFEEKDIVRGCAHDVPLGNIAWSEGTIKRYCPKCVKLTIVGKYDTLDEINRAIINGDIQTSNFETTLGNKDSMGILPPKVSKAAMPPAPTYTPGVKNPKTLILADIRPTKTNDEIQEIYNISREYPLIVALRNRTSLPKAVAFIPDFVLAWTVPYKTPGKPERKPPRLITAKTPFRKEFYVKGERVYEKQTLENILTYYQPREIDFVGMNAAKGMFNDFANDVKKLDFKMEVKELQLSGDS